ncbi:hypothetical protein [Streptomyces sp. NPDC097640]|uniref:hypothetical protein n=1 Tax=Streptomyces sp. NPDC097640 TaxID=3157229 RepID=UPI00331BD63E
MTGLLASARAWQEASTAALRTANSRWRDSTRGLPKDVFNVAHGDKTAVDASDLPRRRRV